MSESSENADKIVRAVSWTNTWLFLIYASVAFGSYYLSQIVQLLKEAK